MGVKEKEVKEMVITNKLKDRLPSSFQRESKAS